MLNKMQFLAVASAFLATEAVAAVLNLNHRHAHPHILQKKDIVYAHTEVVVETEWVTVTVFDGATTTPSVFKAVPPSTTSSSSSSSTSTSSTTTTPSSSSAPSSAPPVTTSSSSIAAAAADVDTGSHADAVESIAEVQAVPTTTLSQAVAAAAAATTPAAAAVATTAAVSSAASSSGSTTSGNKRGVAYNNANLLSSFFGTKSKITWGYNWGQQSDGMTQSGIDYVPMLWSPSSQFTNSWQTNAEKAIASGSKNLLSFNECDNTGQCNLDPASAATAHIKWMNPYAGRAAISAPAITNSNLAGEGISWLKAWVAACNGQCQFDFCAAHWYSPPDPKDLLNHLDQVHAACNGKPVWLTEFAPISGDANAFLAEVMTQLDTNSSYSYVERYSYFMVESGKLVDGSGAINALGTTFGYA